MSLKDSLMGAARSVPGHIAGSVGSGIGAAAGTAAVAGMAVGVQALYNAAVKGRAFKQMMAANPHLAEHEKSDPAKLRQAFTSLYSHTPEFAQDPMLGGEFVSRIMESDRGAGMLLGALEHSRPTPSLMDRVMQGAQMGAVEGVKGKRDGGAPPRGPNVRVRPGGMSRPDLTAHAGGSVSRSPGFMYPKTSFVAQEQVFPGMQHKPTPPNL